MSLTLRPALPADIDAILALLPRLADFSVPAHREPADLWQGDAGLMRAWATGERNDVFAQVAIDANDRLIGVVAASDREDLLTHAPSAHVEILAVAREAEGHGAGRALLEAIERSARTRGATGLSLHVFSNNARARSVYERAGFDEEIVRCFKPLP